MHLEKLEIQGFKSFANKNVLSFPGLVSKSKRGITVIVGPNGSGKSNIADAVRWALGEQSMKTLRGKKAEDIIFSGSDKKSRLGMSEVSLYLNNEDKAAPIDYSEVILTRRLFRSGDSEYLINNSRVRLTDVQIMLAKANFGQKTYSVIGQGMVEGFLNTTLAERKEFFDEATGVKQFQIKRDDSLNKLRASYENLNQVSMLLNEIEPRLRSLTRQVNKLQKRDAIEAELKSLQIRYYGKIWHEINDNFNRYNNRYLELEKIKRDQDKKLTQLTRELEKIELAEKRDVKLGQDMESLAKLQTAKDELIKRIARLDAQLEMKLESKGKFDIAWFAGKQEEITKELNVILEAKQSLEKNVYYDKKKSKELEKKKNEINNRLNKFSLTTEEKGKININEILTKHLAELKQANGETSINRIKDIIGRVRQELKKVVEQFRQEEARESIQEKIIKLTHDKEKLITYINENDLRISARSERVKLLKERQEQIKNELSSIEDKINQAGGIKGPTFSQEKDKLKIKLENTEAEIKDINNKIDSVNLKAEEERKKLFVLQKDMQGLQSEINNINQQLNEIKINSTRHETKLEDLEIEIRHNLGCLNEVRKNRAEEDIEAATALVKIDQLRRQVDLIGGIDPEIQKEYKETKERFDFLSGQVNDLTGATNSLEEIIEELDITIKDRFDKAFKIISDKFEEYFKILFNGGAAKIVKVMEDASELNEADGPADEDSTGQKKDLKTAVSVKKIKFLKSHNVTGLAGIEIQATPPGKKIKSISMLSGGERALTAIALICAIISANPAPFVVLDEVDAALDEANSERLAKILDDLSHKTQFIIITHNRATMRKANVLYGVTMGDDGVSKLLSIKLEEVKV